MKGPGYDICCRRHGISVNLWHKTREEAFNTIEKGKVPLICEDCKNDIDKIFEEDILKSETK